MRVLNKSPAPVQVTAEQLLADANQINDRACERTRFGQANDDDYMLRRRKEFENLVRRQGSRSSVWVKYASWEEKLEEFPRARSVFERALKEVDYKNVNLWVRYAEMEMRNRFVNHARNIWDRAVTLLPRHDQLWYKFIHMEEMLANPANARQLFERWMEWEPGHHAWAAYISFELRCKEVERGRSLYERYVVCIPCSKSWLRYAKFELRNGQSASATSCYKRGLEQLADEDEEMEQLIQGFAALNGVANRRDKAAVEEAVLEKARLKYERHLQNWPSDYDVWFDYVRLEESAQEKVKPERIRQVYELAIEKLPPVQEKGYWKRYIYLWIKYALFEELEAEDLLRASEIYKRCLEAIPHKLFTFSKVWLMAAKLEIRKRNLTSTRKLLGASIGMAPRGKVFEEYIQIELQLGNIQRCRTLYTKYVESMPASCKAWIHFAQFEDSLDEVDRARAIYDIAISAPVLDTPELLWKSYIDMEIARREYNRVAQLYERLLGRTQHVKVWMSYARFFKTELDDSEQARKVFERALECVHWTDEERGVLFQESELGTEAASAMQNLGRKRQNEESWSSLLEAAYSWKRQKPLESRGGA